MMGYEDFESKVLKRNTKKKFKISGSWGVGDIYRSLRKKGWEGFKKPVKETEFYAVIRKINMLLAELLACGYPVAFPFGMGNLELRKFPGQARIVNGKVKVNYPINWHETLRLWFTDEEARKNRILIRFEQPYIYHIKYNRFKANYPNKCYYEFVLNREIKKALKNNIAEGKVDALW